MSPHHGVPSPYPIKEHDWPHFFRLVIISAVASFATLGNIFTISSIIVDDLLRKKGNTFLVSVTLSELLVTAIALPATSVSILAQTENSENLCLFQYGIVSMSCVTSACFTSLVGIENLLRLIALRRLEKERQRRRGQPIIMSVHMMSQSTRQSVCSKFQITILNLLFWVLSAILVGFHFMLMPHLKYTVCGSSSKETLSPNSLIVMGVFLLVFVIFGGLCFLKCVCIMRRWEKPMPYITSREFALVNSNLYNWLVRFLIWCPSIVMAILMQYGPDLMPQNEFISISTHKVTFSSNFTAATSVGTFSTVADKDSPDSSLITLKRLIYWPAILPPCLASLIYAVTNKDFRRCYIQWFNYCCCKTSITLARRPRDNRGGGNDTRVHILPGYNIYSSGQNEILPATPAYRPFNTFKVMSHRRDVYEL